MIITLVNVPNQYESINGVNATTSSIFTDKQISTEQSNTTMANPAIAADSNNYLYAAYVKNQSVSLPSYEISIERSIDAGKSWDEWKTLVTSDVQGIDIGVDIYTDTVFVLYSNYTCILSWRVNTTISDVTEVICGGDYANPSIAIGSETNQPNHIFVAYENTTVTDGTDLYVRRSIDSGDSYLLRLSKTADTPCSGSCQIDNLYIHPDIVIRSNLTLNEPWIYLTYVHWEISYNIIVISGPVSGSWTEQTVYTTSYEISWPVIEQYGRDDIPSGIKGVSILISRIIIVFERYATKTVTGGSWDEWDLVMLYSGDGTSWTTSNDFVGEPVDNNCWLIDNCKQSNERFPHLAINAVLGNFSVLYSKKDTNPPYSFDNVEIVTANLQNLIDWNIYYSAELTTDKDSQNTYDLISFTTPNGKQGQGFVYLDLSNNLHAYGDFIDLSDFSSLVLYELRDDNAYHIIPFGHHSRYRTYKFTFSQSGAVEYDFRLSYFPNFSINVTLDVTSNTERITTDLLDNNVYYFKVRARDSFGTWGTYTAVQNFTVDFNPPNTPEINQPTSNEAIGNTLVNFSWKQSLEEILYYEYYIYYDNLTLTKFASGNITGTSVSYTIPHGDYKWKIRAIDLAGNPSTYSSPLIAFTVDTVAPVAPNIVSPANSSIGNSKSLTIEWTQPIDAVEYHLQVDDNIDFSSPKIDVNQTVYQNTNNSYTEGKYYWRVRVRDQVGNWGNWSSIYYFVVDLTPPDIPVITTMANETYLSDNTPTFEWESVYDAIAYQIQIDDTPFFSTPELDDITALTSFTSSVLNPGIHYWKVRAQDVAGNWCNWTFLRVFYMDASTPDILLLNINQNDVLRSGSMIQFSIIDNYGISEVQFHWDNDTDQLIAHYQFRLPSVDGLHTLKIQATDISGLTSTISFQFVTDDTAPSIQYSSLIDNLIFKPSESLDFVVTDTNSIQKVSFSIDGDTNQTLLSPYDLTLPSNEGEYVISIYATDIAGNIHGEDFIVIIDGTAPTLKFNGIEDGEIVTGIITINLEVTDTHGIESVTYQINENTAIEVNSTSFIIDTTLLTDTEHILVITAIDEAGNENNVSITFSSMNGNSPDSNFTVPPAAIIAASAVAGVSGIGISIRTISRRRFNKALNSMEESFTNAELSGKGKIGD